MSEIDTSTSKMIETKRQECFCKFMWEERTIFAMSGFTNTEISEAISEVTGLGNGEVHFYCCSNVDLGTYVICYDGIPRPQD